VQGGGCRGRCWQRVALRGGRDAGNATWKVFEFHIHRLIIHSMPFIQGWRKNMEDAHVAVLNLRVLAESESMKRLRLAGLEGTRWANGSPPQTPPPELRLPPSSSSPPQPPHVSSDLAMEGFRPVDDADLLNDSVDSVAAMYPADSLELVDGMSLFGVFDGHGGKEVSLFVKKVYAEELLSLEALQRGDVVAALKESFHTVDKMLEDPIYDNVLKQFRKLPNPSERKLASSPPSSSSSVAPIAAAATVTMTAEECTALALVPDAADDVAAAPAPRVPRALKPPPGTIRDDRQVLLDSYVEFAQMRARMQSGTGSTLPTPPTSEA